MARYTPGDPVRRDHLTTHAMVAGNEAHIQRVILDGRLMEWVGFGWIDVTDDDPPRPSEIVPEVGF